MPFISNCSCSSKHSKSTCICIIYMTTSELMNLFNNTTHLCQKLIWSLLNKYQNETNKYDNWRYEATEWPCLKHYPKQRPSILYYTGFSAPSFFHSSLCLFIILCSLYSYRGRNARKYKYYAIFVGLWMNRVFLGLSNMNVITL